MTIPSVKVSSEPVSASAMARSMGWSCWVEVDLDAVAHNVGAIRTWVGPSTKIAAVVKANAYGAGMEVVSRAVLEAGADWLAVARVSEGLRLRRVGVKAPILILTHMWPEEARTVALHDLTPTVTQRRQAQALHHAALTTGKTIPVHIKVDTGLNRLGASPPYARALVRSIRDLPGLAMEGLYTHYATADEADQRFLDQQLASFRQMCRDLTEEGFDFPMYHSANSAATLSRPETHGDMVRVGITLHGYYPSRHVPHSIDLTPAITVKARVARVLYLSEGDTVGYGRTFQVRSPTQAALLSIGYADGLGRSHSRGGEALLQGKRAPILGRVSMDQCVVDVSHLPTVAAGEEAVIIGRQGNESIALDEFAERSGTVPFEVLCNLGARVPRVYVKEGVAVGATTLENDEWQIPDDDPVGAQFIEPRAR